jgi:hypothetical protein
VHGVHECCAQWTQHLKFVDLCCHRRKMWTVSMTLSKQLKCCKDTYSEQLRTSKSSRKMGRTLARCANPLGMQLVSFVSIPTMIADWCVQAGTSLSADIQVHHIIFCSAQYSKHGCVHSRACGNASISVVRLQSTCLQKYELLQGSNLYSCSSGTTVCPAYDKDKKVSFTFGFPW